MVSLRRGSVPLAVSGDGSVHPSSVSSSTKVDVASNEYGCIVFVSVELDDVDTVDDVDVDRTPAPVESRAVANDRAAFAYERHVRPSWSVCFVFAWFCKVEIALLKNRSDRTGPPVLTRISNCAIAKLPIAQAR